MGRAQAVHTQTMTNGNGDEKGRQEIIHDTNNSKYVQFSKSCWRAVPQKRWA